MLISETSELPVFPIEMPIMLYLSLAAAGSRRRLPKFLTDIYCAMRWLLSSTMSVLQVLPGLHSLMAAMTKAPDFLARL